MLAFSVFQRREGRFLSISPAGVSAILSLKSYLRPWRELFKGKHKCIKKLSWDLFIADFAKYVNLYSTHFRWLEDIHHLPQRREQTKSLYLLIFQSKEVHIDKVIKKHWLLWSIISQNQEVTSQLWTDPWRGWFKGPRSLSQPAAAYGSQNPTARASSPNEVSLFKEAAIKSLHVIPAFLLLPLAFTTSPKPVHARQLSKGIEGSSSLKHLEPVVIWMKCRQQEEHGDREGGESSILETEEMRGVDSFSLFLFLKAISPFTTNMCFRDVFEQLGPMASEQSITYLQTDLAYSGSHIIERVRL